MKVKTLCKAALLSVIAIGVAVPTATNAAEHTTTGKGKINYTQDTGDNKDIDPENPKDSVDPKNPDDVTDNDTFGAITIDRVTTLNFPPQKIGVYTEPQVYSANAVSMTNSAGVDVTRGNYVAWTDKRGGNDHKYQIKAKMTKQFTLAGSDTDTLKGATIDYRYGLLNSDMVTTSWPATTAVLDFQLAEGAAESALVFDNNDSTGVEGLGTYTAEFGQSDLDMKNEKGEAAKGSIKDGVKLTVPAGINISEGDYEAEITWSIEFSPAATPEA
ncbi:hypothetical protein UAW_01646 [Enterococcus haemoperoxidus ATCC BAA-382]|uniref:WxL domain-containing protein n=1 Tax=Enterococcus haemoperoxidus ATCC BAA-382 TaxID=1158608 RepID=R2TA99_9ENTE|nr:WxL domain-containing protein [Enterococcus haemoperoxidus]EOH97164.1 hypothetical protein UAW_01646 [Enterococcus haemoperoxidus ATCC BAA-382]EOT59977.1 hypothetical protein I583_02612 [Enterococcus haemoperoxidus ATCC BAA-382]OJG56159.1 hypothetical protein RV06_GL000275 [Enterococcus haemoperoxidus]